LRDSRVRKIPHIEGPPFEFYKKEVYVAEKRTELGGYNEQEGRIFQVGR